MYEIANNSWVYYFSVTLVDTDRCEIQQVLNKESLMTDPNIVIINSPYDHGNTSGFPCHTLAAPPECRQAPAPRATASPFFFPLLFFRVFCPFRG